MVACSEVSGREIVREKRLLHFCSELFQGVSSKLLRSGNLQCSATEKATILHVKGNSPASS